LDTIVPDVLRAANKTSSSPSPFTSPTAAFDLPRNIREYFSRENRRNHLQYVFKIILLVNIVLPLCSFNGGIDIFFFNFIQPVTLLIAGLIYFEYERSATA
jgi:hypothetical protein